MPTRPALDSVTSVAGTTAASCRRYVDGVGDQEAVMGRLVHLVRRSGRAGDLVPPRVTRLPAQVATGGLDGEQAAVARHVTPHRHVREHLPQQVRGRPLHDGVGVRDDVAAGTGDRRR